MSNSVISVRNVSVRLNGRMVLEDVSFDVESPSLITVVGPNGAGKTTLVRLLLGMVRPFKGSVKVLGLDPFDEGSKLRSLVGYVPQRDKVSHEIPLRVGEVVLMGKVLRRRFPRSVSRDDVESAKDILASLGMEAHWDSLYSELSGGQQRRVLIARALASDPELLLFDEVFAGLDSESQGNLLAIIKQLKGRGKSMLLVEHEIDPIMDLTDRILVLNRVVCAYGEPSKVLSEDALRPLYPCLRTIEKEGKRVVILGDKHA
jgi:ABC-type Mn2+/Zn2+ transport system ATPase subunit